jgi:hypothetical protein
MVVKSFTESKDYIEKTDRLLKDLKATQQKIDNIIKPFVK